MSRTLSLPPSGPDRDPPPSVRVQILATEHWSLLATRSTTQSEILSRINMFLTLVSASLVSLALIGQITGFDRRLVIVALVLLAFVLMVGGLTQVRIENGSNEDLAHVVGMNRLRAAYLDVDPSAGQYFVASAHDDDSGVGQTYNHLIPSNRTQVLGSSFVFITFVNAGLAAAFGALCAMAVAAPGWLVGVVAAVVGVGFAVGSFVLTFRRYARMLAAYEPMFPTVRPSVAEDAEPDAQTR